MHNWFKIQAMWVGIFCSLSGHISVAEKATAQGGAALNAFGYVAALSDAKTSLRQVDLPIEVYQKMMRRDFGDLRVFNADNKVVPHQFSPAASVNSIETLALPFYPFRKEQTELDGNISIDINQKTGESKLNIKHALFDQKQNAKKRREYQYVIDNSQTPHAICKLKLDWQQTKPSLILGLRLEDSSDLQNWHTLRDELNVSRLQYENSQLLRDRIEFPCTKQKYLRLTWLKPESLVDSGVQLQKIHGIYAQEKIEQSRWYHFEKPRYDDQGNWLFESNVVVPFIEMEFLAPENGLLYKGKLYSRNNESEGWRLQTEVTQYRLSLGESELQSNAFSLRPTNDRYWRFEPSSESQLDSTQLPEIRAIWRSDPLLFLAQGNAPFQLAFGNPIMAKTSKNDLNSLIQTLEQSGANIDSVVLKEIINKKKTFAAISESTINWKKIILWTVLCLGTFLMSFMAFRLYQQMRGEGGLE